MIQPLWVSENRKVLVSVDDYTEGILKGRLYHATQGMCSFQSLSQFLLRVETLLEEMQEPQCHCLRRQRGHDFHGPGNPEIVRCRYHHKGNGAAVCGQTGSD